MHLYFTQKCRTQGTGYIITYMVPKSSLLSAVKNPLQ